MKKAAVIGCGNIGQRHMRNIKNLFPKATVCAIRSGSGNTSCPADADLLITLDELDSSFELAVVASPANFHVAHASHCLNLNIPTLIEKPLAQDYTQGLHFSDSLSLSKNKLAGVAYCLRYLPSAQFMKQLIEQKQLGQIYNVNAEVGQYLPDWRPGTDYSQSVSARSDLGGGALNELSHELDYINWLFGVDQVLSASLRRSHELNTNVEEIVDAQIKLKNDALATIHLDFLQKRPHRKCTIIAEKARIEWDLIANTITQFDADGVTILFDDSKYDKNNMYLDMLIDFTAQKQNTVSLNEGLEVLHIIQRIRERAQNV
ncbi:MAG TPA: oxidoreductase [Idiomarina abyssalis]|uniref:Gfo/Idh/MocA family protein n=1 Tax=Idiomarina TaxID=135575 RepID=UPI000C0E9413|nr:MULTISPECIES: Gfo/Idh/MocA family oxidoreductase [Idiomarina]MAB22254.1 oxidoreductase [Idiomarina sp.]MBH94437.1 oxidoreductase [Idiomarina sp.]MBQ20532.1 oxidoreductase [Flavobacteriales bacterium]HAS15689.1 oxidoreductase [Idiomarina abyssalis]|tara:strand:+ start:6475 stop:7428 length:954 start_codon:yes stop_codon:yes gene_type:complete